MTEYKTLPPFSATSGPKDAKIVIIGEAWGESEDQCRRPFAGESGKLLWELLGEALPDVAPELHSQISGMFKYGLAWTRDRESWLEAAGILMTNTLAFRPPQNKLDSLCCTKKELPSGYSLPAISRAQYLRPEFLPEISRLYEELRAVRPNLVLALGNTAAWAVLRATNIGSIRGNVAESVELGTSEASEASFTVKVLPTFHPAGVMRQWSWRPIVLADLMKAGREGKFPEIIRPERTAIVNPTLEEVITWTEETLASPPRLLSPDIETGNKQIKCIGFARSRSESIVIPFVDLTHHSGNYWSTPELELKAWSCVARLLESDIPKVGQNFMYDLQYLTRMGIRPWNCLEDTMLLHHSMFPEMQKSLGFLGSIYSSEQSWKLLRRKRPDTEKKDD